MTGQKRGTRTVIKRSVFLHVQDDVLDVTERPGGCARHRQSAREGEQSSLHGGGGLARRGLEEGTRSGWAMGTANRRPTGVRLRDGRCATSPLVPTRFETARVYFELNVCFLSLSNVEHYPTRPGPPRAGILAIHVLLATLWSRVAHSELCQPTR